MDKINKFKLQLFLARQDFAYNRCPIGSWKQRWIPGVCKHNYVRCTHGDEINHRKFRRRICMICGRALKGRLPIDCFFTGQPHSS